MIGNYLITGCGGFIGSYLAEYLVARGNAVYGIVHHNKSRIEHLKDRVTIFNCDMTDRSTVEKIIGEVRPEYVFHLAAQSSIPSSWKDPESTLNTNILGILHILEAVRKTSIDPVITVCGSSSVYGLCKKEEIPLKESTEFRPSSPYAVSKIAQETLAYAYHRGFNLKTRLVRPFYINGPGKNDDACSDFAKGIVRIERGEQTTLMVGNLEAVRDVLDVRDAVIALTLLAEKGESGIAYNLCSGKGHKMRDILDKFVAMSSMPIEVQGDPTRMRPADDPIIVGDNSRLIKLGWKYEIALNETLADILAYWREKGL